MTKIILVRHGRTAWNKEEIFRGTADVPLDDQGRREAACARDHLKRESIHVAYSSPLSRAVETAKIILEPHTVQVGIHPGLVDLDYGEWQGITHDEVKERYQELYRIWKNAPHTIAFPNGESLGSVRERALSVMQEVVEKHPGKVVLLAAHRVVNKVLIAALLGLDNSHFWEIGQDTAAINVFQYSEGKWICRLLNDTCHLRQLEEQTMLDF